MFRKLLHAWNAYWFERTTEFQYGLFRLVFIPTLFALNYFPFRAFAFTTLPVEFFDPTILLRTFRLSAPSPEMVKWLIGAYCVLSFTSWIGLFTRASLILLTAVVIYVDAWINSFGAYFHDTSAPDMTLAILAFSPGVSSFSCDALVRTLWRKLRKQPYAWRDGFRLTNVPKWPARLVLLMLALNYFSAGWSKVRFGELWMSGDVLHYYLSAPKGTYFTTSPRVSDNQKWRDGVGLEAFVYDARTPTWLGKAIAEYRPALVALSAFTLFFEMGFIAALFHRRLRTLFLLLGVVFHLGIFTTMLLDFRIYLACYLMFIDWRALAERFQRRKLALRGGNQA